MLEYGLENASDIDDAVSWIMQNADYKDRKIVLIGQSTGGLAVMAYSSLATNQADAIINFHGGMRAETSDDCRWQARIDAFTFYAKTSRPTSYWVYTANDHSSSSQYIGELFREFLKSGGKAWLTQFGPFKEDGHFLFNDQDGGELWHPKIVNYLKSVDVRF